MVPQKRACFACGPISKGSCAGRCRLRVSNRCDSCSRWRSPPSIAVMSTHVKCITLYTLRRSRRRTASPHLRRRSATSRRMGGPSSGLTHETCSRSRLRRPGCYLVPAHIWTPWFAVLGSRSGFDAVADCYGDLAGEIFAVETGLSSDPRMNWMCSSLDAYRLVSDSDAHSPPARGREATNFRAAMDFFSIAEALRPGDGLAGTIEFYPEEGKYHLDRHRKCGIRFEPRQTRARDRACPECHKPLTVGVLHRVAELADRLDGFRPEGAADFNNLVPLAEIISGILSLGPKSKSANGVIDRLVAAFGPELAILQEVAADARRSWPLSIQRCSAGPPRRSGCHRTGSSGCCDQVHGQVQECWGGSGTGRKCNSIRVFPSVFGFTQSRPRNSATPSS